MSQNASTLKKTLGQTELLLALTEQHGLYQCPGEPLPVSSSVHQARLRANYQKCRTCPHREDAEKFSAETRQHLEEIWQEKRHPSAPLLDGFRGVQWNELNFQDINHICAALCEQLIKQSLQTATTSPENRITLVMGHDSRVSSLAVVDTAIRAVRDCGMKVIDIGEASAPCLRFAVEHLEATAGIHATSAGSPNTHIGLDIYLSGGVPLSGESLYSVKPDHLQSPPTRYGRVSGKLLPFPARKAYLGSLLKYYRDVGPQRVLFLCKNEFLRQLAHDLNQELPVTLIPLTTLTGQEQEEKQHSFSPLLAEEMAHQSVELAVIVGEDGQQCQFFNSQGKKLSPANVINTILKQASGPINERNPIMIGEEFQRNPPSWLQELPQEIRWRQSLRENFARGMRTSRASLGVDIHERYWVAGTTPECDSLVTLGQLLRSYSLQG